MDGKRCSVCGIGEFSGCEMMTDDRTGLPICRSCMERLGRTGRPAKKVSPGDIKAYLDRYVIGQEEAKRALSVALYNHMKRTVHGGMTKSNIMLVGPTGSGKTLLARTLADFTDVPFVICDATRYTPAGYRGEDVEKIIESLYMKSGQDRMKTEHGIVFIDEIDKLRMGDMSGGYKEAGGDAVQQALLKLLEGTVVEIKVPNGMDEETVRISTDDILFIVGGAFPALGDIVRKRRETHRTIGFSSVNDKAPEKGEKPVMEDFVKFGIIPEFMGRLPVITFLSPITRDDCRRILTEPDDSVIKEYERSFSYDDAELVFTPGALDAIADRAIELGTGARALRSIVGSVLESAEFSLPAMEGCKRVTVTEDDVRNSRPPKITAVKELPERLERMREIAPKKQFEPVNCAPDEFDIPF